MLKNNWIIKIVIGKEGLSMKKLKSGISLIILGNLLYLSYIYFAGNEKGSFSDFSSGLLLGLSIGCNVIGIILAASYASNNNVK